MQLGSMFGEREAKLGIEIDDQDSLEDIEARWKNRFEDEGITVSAEELKDLTRRTYEHFFDENGRLRPESVENR
jgi:hypothetical protein